MRMRAKKHLPPYALLLQRAENVTDISQLCIKYVKFLNDEGVEKVRLERGLMAISDILLGGCLEAFIPENFFMRFYRLEKKRIST